MGQGKSVTIRSNVLAGSDAVDSAVCVWPHTERGQLKAAWIEPLAAVSANDTNYITITATQNSTAAFTRVTNVAGGALTANTPEEQTFGAAMVGQKLEVERGDAITFAIAKAGTGPAYELNVVLEYELVN